MDAKGDGGSLIYVAGAAQITVYPEDGVNPAPVGVISDGVDDAYGLFVDGQHDLFAANWDAITAYHPDSLQPYITLQDPDNPLYVVKTHSGVVYASNRDGTVSEFLPHHTTADRILKTPGAEADGINLDDAGNLYVAYRDESGIGSIEEFLANSRKGRILGMRLAGPQGLQLDHSGNILVVETADKQQVSIFAPGRKTPSKVVRANGGVTQVVLREANENMYVSDWEDHDVFISRYPPGQFHLKIGTGMGIQGMALSNEER